MDSEIRDPQLLKVLDHWIEMLDEGNCLDVLYLDFSKAYDTVLHVVW